MKKKIAFLLPNLLMGGTQKVIINIANNLNKERFEVYLIVVNQASIKYKNKNYKEKSFYDLIDHDQVKHINLESKGVKWSGLKIRQCLKDIQPHIVFSSLSYLNLYMGLIKPILPGSTTYIARESNTLSVKNKHLNAPGYMNRLYQIFYKKFDKIICQSNDMYVDLIENYSLPKIQLTTINNPIDTDQTIAKGKEPFVYDPDSKNIVCVGHMSYQKGHDLLMEALRLLKNPNWHCHIIGREGKMKKLVDQFLTDHKDIADRIHLHGFQSNPFNYLVNADLFVLSSRFEGFPNVLLEAGAYGLPIVAFDNPGGMAEIVSDEQLGLLAKSNDSKDLAEKIDLALTKKFDSQFIKDYFRRKYDKSVILAKYEELFETC